MKKKATYKDWYTPKEGKQVKSEYTRGMWYQIPLETRKGVKEKQFFHFLKIFYGKIGDEIVMNNWKYNIGYSCGSLSIIKREATASKYPILKDGSVNMRGKKIKWFPTFQLWKEKPELRAKVFIYFTSDFTFVLNWDKHRAKVINADLYSFRSVRSFRNKIRRAVEQGKDYFTKEPIIV